MSTYPKPIASQLVYFWHWANERQTIYLAKEAGLPRELWTADPILAKYRFCNLYREQDAVTKWVNEHIRLKYKDSPHLWFMLMIARILNKPETMQHLMDSKVWPEKTFHPANIVKALDAWKAKGNTIFNAAYIISGGGMDTSRYSSKHEWLFHEGLSAIWDVREDISNYIEQCDRIQYVTEFISGLPNFGSFMAYQVAVDLRYTRYLRNATDKFTYASFGPGSRRGLNRLFRGDPAANVSDKHHLEELRVIERSQDDWRDPAYPRIEMNDLQNAMCETDKFMRAYNGEGTPKQIYRPA
jgi:hypothetical protein